MTTTTMPSHATATTWQEWQDFPPTMRGTSKHRTGQAVVEYGGQRWLVGLHEVQPPYPDAKGNVVVYVDLCESAQAIATANYPEPVVKDYPALLDPNDFSGGADSPAWTERKVYPTIDRDWDAHNRAVKRAWTLFAERLLGQEGGKFSASRNAGCSCGCSPGVVWKESNRRRGTSIHLTVEPLTA